ncbi:MAG: metallophosphoesterase [Hyphomonadaceae bacterium]
MSARFILAQISDTHVRPESPEATANLRRAFDGARAYGADAIMLTGDLINDERQPEQYDILVDALRDPPAPLYLLPGNHDLPDVMRARFPDHGYLPKQGPYSFAIDRFPVRLVGIDQHAPGAVAGVFTEEHARWLDETLQRASDKPTLVALHHPPFPTHDLLFDTIGLLGADLFSSVVGRHRQVQRIICGHHHRVAVGQVAHAPVVIAPSTSWVYGLALQDGQEIAPRTGETPGWMLHAWTASGGFASHFMGL